MIEFLSRCKYRTLGAKFEVGWAGHPNSQWNSLPRASTWATTCTGFLDGLQQKSANYYHGRSGIVNS